MRTAIFSTAAEQIRAHARREHPREACGLLLGRDGCIERAVEAANVADRPDRAFEIDPATLLRCHREAREGGLELLGWYHSHPNGRAEPSAVDVDRAVEAGRLWLIVAGGHLRAFRAVGDGRGFTDVELDAAATTPP
jgi:desampylase